MTPEISGLGMRCWCVLSAGHESGCSWRVIFRFETDADRATAPMLAGARPRDIVTLGRRVRTAWLGFIRTGTPQPTKLHGRSGRPLCHCWSRRSKASRNAALEVTPSLGKSW